MYRKLFQITGVKETDLIYHRCASNLSNYFSHVMFDTFLILFCELTKLWRWWPSRANNWRSSISEHPLKETRRGDEYAKQLGCKANSVPGPCSKPWEDPMTIKAFLVETQGALVLRWLSGRYTTFLRTRIVASGRGIVFVVIVIFPTFFHNPVHTLFVFASVFLI